MLQQLCVGRDQVSTHVLTPCYVGSTPIRSTIVFDNDRAWRYNKMVKTCDIRFKKHSEVDPECFLFKNARRQINFIHISMLQSD
jgi:hypothetical protein